MSSMIEFIVVHNGENVILVEANCNDTVESVKETIKERINIQVSDQFLLYKNKEVGSGIRLDEIFQVSGGEFKFVNMREIDDITQNPTHKGAWNVLNKFVFSMDSIIQEDDKEEASILVRGSLSEFLKNLPKDIEVCRKYINIFNISSALSGLLKLCLSKNTYHKEFAMHLVSDLLDWIHRLPLEFRVLTAPTLMKLCFGLKDSRRAIHLLRAVRATLGCMIVYGNLPDVTLSDIGIIVNNIILKICHNLKKGKQSYTMLCREILTDVVDLRLFLLPFKRMEGPDFIMYKEVITSIQSALLSLITHMGLCLGKMQNILANSSHVGSYGHLQILYVLQSVPGFFQNIESRLWSMLTERKVSFCHLLIEHSNREDSHEWVSNHKDLTTFECRRHLAMLLFPQVNHSAEPHVILINRSLILEDSYEKIARVEANKLRDFLVVKFEDEEAYGPGVIAEWLVLVCEDLFHHQKPFFAACPGDYRRWLVLVCEDLFHHQKPFFAACPGDYRRFWPNPATKVDHLPLDYFRFAGRVIALALVHKVQIGIVLDRVFFQQLSGKPLSLEDIKDAEPVLYRSWKKMLDMDPKEIDDDVLALRFMYKDVELVQDGESISVNSKNIRKYVDLLIDHHFVKSIAEPVAQFTEGFTDIINSSENRKLFFQSLEPEDLESMLRGSDRPICVEDWEAITDYSGYKDTDPQIVWFWKIVWGMSAKHRKALLLFWTSVRYLPVEGFKGLSPPLSICKIDMEDKDWQRFPSSHTCSYQLCVPSYPSFEVLRDHLYLITQEQLSSTFSNV